MNYSVIIPYRDTYELLLRACDSVPDRDDIQILIVDNSVVPLTHERVPVKSAARVDFFCSDPTKGAGCARNVGLDHAVGDRLLFLDADDVFTDTAFAAFDVFLSTDYDIVFFPPASVVLSSGQSGTRHRYYADMVDEYLSTCDEERVRYRYFPPWSKLFRRSFIEAERIRFDVLPVSNDVMFSLRCGHAARTVTASSQVVYTVSEGECNNSLTTRRSRANMFIRYQVAVAQYRFVSEHGHPKMRFHLLSKVVDAFRFFGIREGFKYVRYSLTNRVNIFYGLLQMTNKKTR
ncbi:MAG: hypothetical protein AUK63_224 [bacterium P3]|nr:MAG: hypothetical protein AUK63_224 [bacterium P3]KWW42314.1 MAG: hypothetical protein F083_218 [bacterium F083]